MSQVQTASRRPWPKRRWTRSGSTPPGRRSTVEPSGWFRNGRTGAPSTRIAPLWWSAGKVRCCFSQERQVLLLLSDLPTQAQHFGAFRATGRLQIGSLRGRNLGLGRELPTPSRHDNTLPDRPQGRRLDVSTFPGEPPGTRTNLGLSRRRIHLDQFRRS
jgi:hypothetical protein